MPCHTALFAAFLAVVVQASAGDAFEWAGLFTLTDNTYVWGAEKVDGAYADPAMKLVMIPASGVTDADLEATEATGNSLIEGNCTTVLAGATLTASASTCYSLVFDQTTHLSLYNIDATGVTNVAFYAEHVPTEFERNSHYLKDVNGEDIEPLHQLPEAEPKAKPWGTALGAAFVVNILTFTGVVCLVPAFGNAAKSHPVAVSVIVNAFAAGALLAAAFYLMFYEATHLIKPAGSTEAGQTAWWGSMALLGFLTPYIIHLISQFVMGAPPPPTATKDVEGSNEVVVEVIDRRKQVRVIGGIIIGDFMHNFVDGIFIGFGFFACDSTTGWTITSATIIHEIGQEIADYLVLTDPAQAALAPAKALVFNFVSGTSVLLGVLFILTRGTEDGTLNGCLLAFGGGIYLQVACSECMTRVGQAAKSAKMLLIALVVFVLGVLAIGLVLLNHEHCAPGGGHAHAH